MNRIIICIITSLAIAFHITYAHAGISKQNQFSPDPSPMLTRELSASIQQYRILPPHHRFLIHEDDSAPVPIYVGEKFSFKEITTITPIPTHADATRAQCIVSPEQKLELMSGELSTSGYAIRVNNEHPYDITDAASLINHCVQGAIFVHTGSFLGAFNLERDDLKAQVKTRINQSISDQSVQDSKPITVIGNVSTHVVNVNTPTHTATLAYYDRCTVMGGSEVISWGEMSNQKQVLLQVVSVPMNEMTDSSRTLCPENTFFVESKALFETWENTSEKLSNARSLAAKFVPALNMFQDSRMITLWKEKDFFVYETKYGRICKLSKDTKLFPLGQDVYYVVGNENNRGGTPRTGVRNQDACQEGAFVLTPRENERFL